MPARFAVFEVSHRTARRTLREALARDGASWMVDRVAHVGPVDDWRLLQTCGRFELYVVASEEKLATLAASLKTTWCRTTGSLIVRRGFEAVEHLFRLASGLESPILGEDEILGQVRDLLDQPRNTAKDRLLERLLQQAVHVGRRVRQETALGSAQHSYGERALAAALERLPSTGRVTIYGTGRLARSVCEAFPAGLAYSLSICSRHAARVHAFADEFRATPIEPAALLYHLTTQDVLIACTAARQPVITVETFAIAREKPLCVIDLGLPANVDRGVADLPWVELITLDDLVDASLSALPAVQAAERIITAELARFRTWRAMQGLGPQMQATLAAQPDASPAERHARIRAIQEGVA